LSDSRANSLQRIGAASGIIAPIFAFICIIIAIATHLQFSWINNALSDLGVIQGVTGIIFNVGLFACGLLALNFAIFGMYSYFKGNLLGKIGVGVFAAATIALICIGIFNENFSPTHYLVSVAFFVFLPISLLIITGTFAVKHQTKMAMFTILVAIIAAAPWVLYFIIHYAPNVAIPEIISGLAGASWIITLGIKILEKNRSIETIN
jgi:hypothetical membrane protein